MKNRTNELIEEFFDKNSDIFEYREAIDEILQVLISAATSGKKILICGNGGSAADSDHIVGELMKGFELSRPLSNVQKDRFESKYGNEGLAIANKLQGAIPAISLLAHSALISAFENDVDPTLIYAQQVNGYGTPGDVLIGISTSGNAENVNKAVMTANVLGLETIGLTGKTGGRLQELSKYCFVAPANTTFETQEYHLKVYHLLCRALESEVFEK